MFKKINATTYNELKSKYKWLRVNNSIEDYLEPQYYNHILKDYIFSGKSDLEVFRTFLKRNTNPKTALELGSGSGRVTDVFLNFRNYANWDCKLDILDLSKQMLSYCKNKYADVNYIQYINSDTFEFLSRCEKKYDLVYSLWSYSHSIHQILPRLGDEKGREYVAKTLKKFIKNNLTPNGKMFIIHFDTQSQEQSILIHQWKKLYKMFSDTKKQSPSLQITLKALEELKQNKEISYSVKHLISDGIVYQNENEALETFLNFHMEFEFNDLEILPQVIDELRNNFSNYRNEKGQIVIKTGCFVIEIQKSE